jgi:ribulose-bisphosphate carboxylase large chain
MDQSDRYADLGLDEATLIRDGRHILAAYKMRPKAGHAYLEAAAHFAAESSTGTNVAVSTTDDFTRGVDALVYHIDAATDEMRIAYPLELFDRNMTDGRMMMVSFLTLAMGNNQGMGDIEHAKLYDFWVPDRALQLFDGPAKDISDLWRILGRSVTDGGYISGTIIKPKLGLRPKPFATGCVPVLARRRLHQERRAAGEPGLRADEAGDPARRRRDAPRDGRDGPGEALLGEHHRRRPLRDVRARRLHPRDLRRRRGQGRVPGGRIRRRAGDGDHRAPAVREPVPALHRAGHGMVTSPSAKRGYTAYVLAKMARLQGASGIHVGTMGYGKMEGEHDDRAIAYIIERDEFQGPAYFQRWLGMKPTTPIISGGMNALRLPGFFQNLGHGNVINTAGGGSYGHIDSPAAGAISLRQAYECWKAGADPVEWATTHREFARAFESFPGDADALYPGWRARLGVAAR